MIDGSMERKEGWADDFPVRTKLGFFKGFGMHTSLRVRRSRLGGNTGSSLLELG
jgi:hypothetical protein